MNTFEFYAHVMGMIPEGSKILSNKNREIKGKVTLFVSYLFEGNAYNAILVAPQQQKGGING